jgi:hypothetical protein
VSTHNAGVAPSLAKGKKSAPLPLRKKLKKTSASPQGGVGVGGGDVTQQKELRQRVGEEEREVNASNASDILRYSTLNPREHLNT